MQTTKSDISLNFVVLINTSLKYWVANCNAIQNQTSSNKLHATLKVP